MKLQKGFGSNPKSNLTSPTINLTSNPLVVLHLYNFQCMKIDGHKILPVFTVFRIPQMMMCDQNDMFVPFRSHLNTAALAANSLCIKNLFKFLRL